MLILLMWLGGDGESRGKMLILLMLRIKILIHLKKACKSVKYHLTLWSKALNLIQYVMHI